jgi:hypothetical protein
VFYFLKICCVLIFFRSFLSLEKIFVVCFEKCDRYGVTPENPFG